MESLLSAYAGDDESPKRQEITEPSPVYILPPALSQQPSFTSTEPNVSSQDSNATSNSSIIPANNLGTRFFIFISFFARSF